MITLTTMGYECRDCRLIWGHLADYHEHMLYRHKKVWDWRARRFVRATVKNLARYGVVA